MNITDCFHLSGAKGQKQLEHLFEYSVWSRHPALSNTGGAEGGCLISVHKRKRRQLIQLLKTQNLSTLRLARENKTAYWGGTCCLCLWLYQDFSHFLLHYQVCGTACVQFAVSLWGKVSNMTTHTRQHAKQVLLKKTFGGIVAGFASMQLVLHGCICVRWCGSLYHVGIRPLALVLITHSCLHRPRNLPPLKCGFKKKKKRINPLALVVSALSLSQPTPRVSVLVAPPCPHNRSPCHLSQQASLPLAN